MTARSVLHVAAPVDGGVPRYVAALARDQLERGWRVAVASPPEGDLARLLEGSGAELIAWKAQRAPGPSALLEARRLTRIVDAVDPDLVHLHSAKAGLAGRLAVRGRRPTIFTPNAWSFEAVRGSLRAASIAWERLAARWTDVILCVSDAERARGAEVIEADWRVVRTGIDVDAFPHGTDAERRRSRTKVGLNGAPVAVCVGRLCEQKGQDVLLKAWPAVLEEVPDAELVFVGDGPDRPALESGAPPGVRFAGVRDDVAEWLLAADVVVQPSRWEGMSIVMLEAMACGRSIVMTDVDGTREAITGSGAIVPVDDPRATAAAVAERLADPVLTAREGERARERAEALHTFEGAADAIADVYDEVLEDEPLVGAPVPVFAGAGRAPAGARS